MNLWSYHRQLPPDGLVLEQGKPPPYTMLSPQLLQEAIRDVIPLFMRHQLQDGRGHPCLGHDKRRAGTPACQRLGLCDAAQGLGELLDPTCRAEWVGCVCGCVRVYLKGHVFWWLKREAQRTTMGSPLESKICPNGAEARREDQSHYGPKVVCAWSRASALQA